MNSYDKFVQNNRMRVCANHRTPRQFFISSDPRGPRPIQKKYLCRDMGFRYYSDVSHDDFMITYSKENSVRIIRTVLKNTKRIVYDF